MSRGVDRHEAVGGRARDIARTPVLIAALLVIAYVPWLSPSLAGGSVLNEDTRGYSSYSGCAGASTNSRLVSAARRNSRFSSAIARTLIALGHTASQR